MNKDVLYKDLIPKPVSIKRQEGLLCFGVETKICVQPGCDQALKAAEHIAQTLRSLTGFPLPIEICTEEPKQGCLFFTSQGAREELGEEGYSLTVSAGLVTIRAHTFPGFFFAGQTLRQLLPPGEGPWQLEGVEIIDYPRFAWRGAMLDVARSFFSVDEIKRVIDLLAGYKFNRLHLHLSDDQGWRIMIDSWPNLALHGGSGAVEGGRAGYYTKDQYREIAAYAQRRAMILVPEIDLPGHTNAALAAYPELNRDGIAPEPYRGIQVGFSTLAVEKEITYQFVRDVLGELAELTPGPYLHVGGDEAHSTTLEEYKLFLERVHTIVAETGKTLVGWDEIIQAGLEPTDLVQIWRRETKAQAAAGRGAKLIMSPCHHIYLDMKYNPETVLGQDWAALIEVKDAYGWDPVTVYPGLAEEDILGVEAPLWAETLRTIKDVEYMLFPRILGVAEIGWSPREGRSWEEYRQRLAAHEPRLEVQGVHFYRSPQVPWKGR
jgi:hexosaminidase